MFPLFRKLYYSLIFCFFLPALSVGQVPTKSLVFLDSLSLAQDKDSLNGYIELLRSFAKSLRGLPEKNQIIVDTFQKYRPFREPVTASEHSSVRGWYASLLYSERQIYGDLALNMELAKQATKYNYEKEVVDRNGKFIEQPIADYYARTDDYDQSIFWYNSMIAGCKKRNDYNRLCLVFKSISESYSFKNDMDRVGDYLDSTRLYLPLTIGERARLAFQVTELEQIQPKERGVIWKGKVLALLNELEQPEGRKYRSDVLDLLVENSLVNQQYEEAEKYLFRLREIVSITDRSKQIKRELAKVELKLVKIALQTFEHDSLNRRMNRAFFCLTGKLQSEYDLSKDLYPENTLVEWWQIKGEQHLRAYEKGSELSSIEESIKAAEIAIKTNNIIRDPILQSKSEQLSAGLTRELYDDLIKRYILRYKHDPEERTIAKIEQTIIHSNDYFLRERKVFDEAVGLLSKDLQAKIIGLQKQLSKSQHALYSSNSSDNEDLQIEILSIRKEIQDSLKPFIAVREKTSQSFEAPYLAIYRTQDHIYSIFRSQKDEVEIRTNPTSEIDQKMKRFRELILIHTEFNDLSVLLTNLYDEVVPTDAILPEVITVFLDGALADFPIELLRKNKRYLLEDHKIQYFQVNTDEQSINSSEVDRKWLFVRPEYPKDSRSFAMLDENARSGFYNLAFAQKEVQGIVNVLREESDILEIIEFEVLDSMIQNSDILHFAGHGKAWADSAYLVLFNSKGYEKWHAGQISEKSYDLDLVTLSACETGLGEYVSGDGIQSIGRSFLAAGAKAVCYTLWTVNDNATSDLMTAFYKNMRKGMPKNEALQNAKLNFLAKASPEKRHPYFWAGIVIQGNNQALFETPNLSYFAILSLLSLAFILLVFFTKRKIKT